MCKYKGGSYEVAVSEHPNYSNKGMKRGDSSIRTIALKAVLIHILRKKP